MSRQRSRHGIVLNSRTFMHRNRNVLKKLQRQLERSLKKHLEGKSSKSAVRYANKALLLLKNGQLRQKAEYVLPRIMNIFSLESLLYVPKHKTSEHNFMEFLYEISALYDITEDLADTLAHTFIHEEMLFVLKAKNDPNEMKPLNNLIDYLERARKMNVGNDVITLYINKALESAKEKANNYYNANCNQECKNHIRDEAARHVNVAVGDFKNHDNNDNNFSSRMTRSSSNSSAGDNASNKRKKSSKRKNSNSPNNFSRKIIDDNISKSRVKSDNNTSSLSKNIDSSSGLNLSASAFDNNSSASNKRPSLSQFPSSNKTSFSGKNSSFFSKKKNTKTTNKKKSSSTMKARNT